MKKLRKIISLVLISLLIITSAPLLNFDISDLRLIASASNFKVGSIVEFGSYPQSEVTDSALIMSLNNLTPPWEEWADYGYYSGDGNVGSMIQGDWMKYTDVVYNNEKYRGVMFTQYRPYYTYKTSAVTYQDDNGYDMDTVYWFRFEPIEWRILNSDTGLVMCETIVDAQPYNTTIYNCGDGIYDYYSDSSLTNYASNYETSSIRAWLNNDFYYTAFTLEERQQIRNTPINNNGYYTSVGTSEFETLDCNSTEDKLFLLSYNDVKNQKSEFDPDSVKLDAARRAFGSDYAKIQGLYVYNDVESIYNGNSFWTLRTPGNISCCSCYVTYQGCSRSFYSVDYIGGIRPAFCFGWGEGGNPTDDLSGGTGKYKREHVVDDWMSLNESFIPKYLKGKAVPMDGTNGNPDYLIPGQTQDMIPQGIAYWPEKDWVLVSSYDKSELNSSVIFALDRTTGAFVAQFNLKDEVDGKIVDWKPHAGGIGVSENNLYITEDSGVSYFPLSDLDISGGSVKNIVRKGHIDFGQLGKACADYVNVSDGFLWAGNFYSNYPGWTGLEVILEGLKILPPAWDTPAASDFNSVVLGFKLTGGSSETEWNNLKKIKNAATFRIGIDNDLQCIQGIAFKKIDDSTYRMYLSRTTDVSFGGEISYTTITFNKNNIDIETKDDQFKYIKNLPGTEGITFIGDDLHILYESGALSGYGSLFWNETLKDCTDVIWKISDDDLLFWVGPKGEWFENNSYSGYNHELAKFCVELITLGYEYNETIVANGLEEVGLSVKSINMNAERDEVNYFIADKNIDVNGVDKNLIVIGCIGSYKNQWYSNFDPLGYARENKYADDSEINVNHIGFADARDYVYGKLNKYIEDNKIDKSNCIILLTGHSRGAATVNLLGAKLIDNSFSFGVSANNIYTYGFATPNTTTKTNSSKYHSIINIVNPEDFVTKVMLNSWGYGRYGKTYTLPSKSNDNKYQAYLNKMRPFFKETTGELYDPYKMGEVKTYKMVKNFSEEVETVDDFYSETFWYSMSIDDAFIFETPYVFFRNTLLNYLVSDDMSGILDIILFCGPFYLGIIAYFAWPDISTNEAINALLIGESIFNGVIVGGKFKQAHQIETYSAYLHSMTSAEVTQYRAGHNGTVNCPVDIEIYDKETGELVGRIVNNVVDEEIAAKENSIVMDVDGDSKSFWLPSNGDYEIKLIGNDDGTMDYTMSKVDSDIGEVERVNFFGVEITDGLTMTADVISEEFVVEEHELVYQNGETLKPTEIFGEENIGTYNIDIYSTKGGSASSSQTVKSGDYVSIEAKAADGWKFIGWYENYVLISTEPVFAFVAKCDRSFEAKFEHINHSFESWYVVESSTCKTTGTEQCDCSKCDYSETREIPANGHSLGDWYVSIPAKCEVKGTEQRDCSECDYFETKEIPAAEHSYEPVVTPATCHSKGFTTNICSVCNSGYTSDVTEKLPHSLGNWYVVTPANCETAGNQQRDCSGCNYSENQTIPATGHDFSGSVCVNCGLDNAHGCDCNCHADGIKKFFFNFILFFQKLFKKNQICACGSYHY